MQRERVLHITASQGVSSCVSVILILSLTHCKISREWEGSQAEIRLACELICVEFSYLSYLRWEDPHCRWEVPLCGLGAEHWHMCVFTALTLNCACHVTSSLKSLTVTSCWVD